MAVGTLLSNAYGFRGNQHAGYSHRLMTGREIAAQSFKAGAVLIRNAGALQIAAADQITDIVGVATEPATGVTGDLVTHIPATPDMVFEATLEDQANENHALVLANIFTDFGIQVDASGNFYLDENELVNTACCVVAPLNDRDITDATARARVLCVFLEDVTIYNT